MRGSSAGIDGRARVSDAKRDPIREPFDRNLNGVGGFPVRERVSQQVGDDLRQTVRVPSTGEVTVGIQVDMPPGMGRDQLIDAETADLSEVHGGWRHGKLGVEAQPGEVEELFDHPGHALRASVDAVEDEP
jgi:hypothetical protein